MNRDKASPSQDSFATNPLGNARFSKFPQIGAPCVWQIDGGTCSIQKFIIQGGRHAFDWHSDRIDAQTPVTATYKNTQNVRRFMTEQCGAGFKFDRPFMAWVKDGRDKTMGDVVAEWQRRQMKSRPPG
ncbi:hypothetical protein ROLI_004630 [Roseobacter fucihabitans]|uniref:DUF6434 domain-containing protein n=1 Tax=Roseobacter fucihabitans TaxID=1537242 RepID=A0ABZ2BPY0_9RHOB|nr:DUF6434 domain-containing protein [Roseobacter litoralis]MBC6964637.1 hypothetical protein [Roseobacter litoralis]